MPVLISNIGSLGRDLSPEWWDEDADYGTTPTYGNAPWFGLGDLAGEAETNAALERLSRFVASCPKPGPGKTIRADVLLGALKQLEVLAARVAKLKVGAFKTGWLSRKIGPSLSYLTGKTVTEKDVQYANDLLYEIRERLPKLMGGPVEPWLYSQIKDKAHHILKVGTDLDVQDTSGDMIARYFESVKEALIELPTTLKTVAEKATWGLIPTWVKVAVPVAGVLAIIGIYKVAKAAAPVAVDVAARRYGLRGFGSPMKHRRRRRRNLGCGCTG